MGILIPFRTRWLVFSLLLGLPILRMLLRAEYSLLNLETAAAVALAIAAGAMLAAISRSRILLELVTVGVIVLLSVNAFRNDFLPEVRPRWILLGLLLATAVAIRTLRRNFYKVLLIFLAGSFLADVGTLVVQRFSAAGHDSAGESDVAARGRTHRHVIHIIFDEMQGLGAMPAGCSSCAAAVAEIEETLRRDNFRIYPYAFANYQRTRDSVPSILNDRLLVRTGEYVSDFSNRLPTLAENGYFDKYLKANYAVRAYQSDHILFTSPKHPSLDVKTYQVNSLKALRLMNLNWQDRLRQILTLYIRSDKIWREAWMGLMPRRWQFFQTQVGPLAVQEIWPAGILRDIRSAKRDTLFFAHFLIPHQPFVYKPDGSLRFLRGVPYETGDEATHSEQFELYGEQARFLARQIRQFLDGLHTIGQFDSSTIIFHGDHGSRLRLLTPLEREGFQKLHKTTPYTPAANRYDYAAEPARSSLMNRFATLLALKLPGATGPERIIEAGSVLYFLRRDAPGFSTRPPADAAINSVYLFDAKGLPRSIPILQIWQPVGR